MGEKGDELGKNQIYVGFGVPRDDKDREKPATVKSEDVSHFLSDEAIAGYNGLKESSDSEIQQLTEELDHILTLSTGVLQAIEDSLEGIHGAGLIHDVAAANILKQAGFLIIGTSAVQSKGEALVSKFGEYKTLRSYREILDELQEIRQDFEFVIQQKKDFATFNSIMLPVINKYLFDGRNIEQAAQKDVSIGIYYDFYPFSDELKNEQYKESIKRLTHDIAVSGGKQNEIIEDWNTYICGPVVALSYYPGMFNSLGIFGDVLADLEKENLYSRPSAEAKRKYNLPDILIIDVPEDDENFEFRGYGAWHRNNSTYNDLFISLYEDIPYEQRPTIIFYTPDKNFSGPRLDYCLYATNKDELMSMVQLAKNVQALKSKSTILSADVMAKAQEKLYDTLDLASIEHHTADTFQELRVILPLLDQYGVRNVFECGTGAGRIGIPIAMTGRYVLGGDISTRQLEDGKVRLVHELEGINGKRKHPGLSYEALQALMKSGVITRDQLVTDVDELAKKYITTNMDLSKVIGDAHRLLTGKWHEEFPQTSFDDFFNLNPYWYMAGGEYDIFDSPNIFHEIGFDAIVSAWHVSLELGSPEALQVYTHDVHDMIRAEGVYIEGIPDRQVGPYPESLNKFHKDHPDLPLGTIVDSTPTEPGESTASGTEQDTPRYFPDITERILQLRSVGFVNIRVVPYLVTTKDANGERYLQVKESIIVAERPRY